MEKERMQWVDAMRGFSMIIVVLGHVLLNMGEGGYSSFLSSILLTFRMPLFFFVSGFFSFRLYSWWNRERLSDILIRKFKAQIFCAVCFLSVYQLVMSGGVNLNNGFSEYWFTIVLFQMYLIYLLLSILSKKLKKNIVIPALILISLLFIVVLTIYDREGWMWNFLCWENMSKYMQFFAVGIICSKYRILFFRMLSNNLFTTLMIVGWITCMILWYNDSFRLGYPFIYSVVHDIIVRYCALATVIIIFFSNRERFLSNSKSVKVMCFIGRRTLDIYMIHYFFIPRLYFLHIYLDHGNMLVLQLVISLSITTVVVALCLLISSILRKSITLENWLFGVKAQKV